MSASAHTIGFKRVIAPLAVLIAFGLIVLAMPAAALATTRYVSVIGTDGVGDGTYAHPYASVQKAVNMSHGGDIVSVGPGTFSGDVGMQDGVSLRGAGAGLTTLHGTGSGPVIIAIGIGSGVTVSGFTITAGYGGIYCASDSSLTISANTIRGNSAPGIGGIRCYHASPTIADNMIVDNNTTAYDGGGIDCDNSSAVIRDNTISDNSAKTTGGGIYCVVGSPTITGNTISGNSATVSGGGINCYISSPTISGNTILGNTATNNGGGINCDTSSPPITGNKIIGNSTSGYGGGIWCNSSPAITGNDIIGNNSSGTGGGIYTSAASPAIKNCVVAGNSANGGGGGMFFMNPSTPTVTNDTINGNNAGFFGGGINSAFSTPVITNCIVWKNSSDLMGCSATYSDVSSGGGLAGDINADPAFVAPETGDYHLTAVSPCLNDASPTVAPATDRDGIARPWGAGYDMGAYEYRPATLQLHYIAGSGGTLSGATSQIVAYNASGSAVTAVPNTGYHFANWSDGRGDNPRTDSGVTGDVNVTANFASNPVSVTTMKLSGASSVKVKKSYKLSGSISPSAVEGGVKIALTRLVGKKWKSAGSANATLSGGKFAYSFKPKYKGSWKATVSFGGQYASATTYAACSASTSFKVK